YAVPVGEQIYKSTNGGETWDLLNGSPRVRNWNAVGNFGVDMADSQHLYYFDSERLYETVDGGESWQVLSIPCGGWTLAVDPQNGKHLFIGCSQWRGGQKLAESKDGGRTWNLLDFLTPADILSLVVAPETPSVLYANYEAGLAKSTDGGHTWAYLRESGGSLTLAVHPANPEIVILGQLGGPGPIERSLNGGVAWETVGWADGGTNTIEFAPADPRFVYLGAAGVYRSTDGGASWALMGADFPAGYVRLYVYPTQPDILFAENRVGHLYRSSDGGVTWTSLNVSGLGLGIDAQSGTLYRADHEQIWRSTDSGLTWTSVETGLGCPDACPYRVYVNPTDSQWIYHLGSPLLHQSRDGGLTWERVENGPIGELLLAPDGKRVYAVGSEGNVFVSNDGGETWEKR
ncbi:hypothetical protein D6833_03485, partial [Candidatus Parcubacteria bacterium]